MPNANQWLEENYPEDSVCQIDDVCKNKGKKRSEITQLSVSQKNLTGPLDLSSFTNLEALFCWDNQLTVIILLSNFSLKELHCSYNQLTSLNVSNCLKLTDLKCWDNQLTELILPTNDQLSSSELNHWVSSNELSNISVANNYLTTFNYACLNPLTIKDLRINNNNLESTDLEVFVSFVNLTDLCIGNADSWIQAGNQGNQFTGSLSSFQGLTKLENLQIDNLSLQPNLEYLPTSLQEIMCNGQIWKELKLYGWNLTLWQVHHPHLMKQANKAIVHLTDYQLVTSKQISVHTAWLESRETQQASFNYSQQLTYSDFLVKDIHPFSWELEKALEYNSGEWNVPKNKVFWESNNSSENKFSEVDISREKQLPLRLYNLVTNKVINSKDEQNINNYLILSYCWGNDWENNPQSYGQSYQTDLTKLGRKALNKVKATYQFLKENHNLDVNHIWIDNFCINQADCTEKEQEVKNQRNYYSNASATLIAIDAEIGEINESDREKFMNHLVRKITKSQWFTRAWTFQEGVLSQQNIFMFDDALVDGRSLAFYWGGVNGGTYNNKPCTFITPFGWSAGNKNEKISHLNLGEALLAVTHRNQTVLLDKIYSFLGLLPYGDQLHVEYQNESTIADLENKLLELIKQAYLHNPNEIISYLGRRNSNNWWLPTIDATDSWQIEGFLNYDDRFCQHCLNQIQEVTKQGIQLRGHFTIKDDWQIIELDRFDRKNNTRWPVTLQFILNVKNKFIAIERVEEFYYSHGKQRATDLFLDMVNFKVIESEVNIKEYLQLLESQRSAQLLVEQQQSVDNSQQSIQFVEQSQLVDQFNTFQIQDN